MKITTLSRTTVLLATLGLLELASPILDAHLQALVQFRDLIERLKDAGVPLRKPVEDCWYRDNDILHGQRNFLVQDPDGYLLRFAESLGTKPLEKFVV